MKVQVVGYRPYSFKDENDGRDVKGISLFVNYPEPMTEGLRGNTNNRFTIKSGTAVYDRLLNHRFTGAFEADADMVPSGNKMVLADLRFAVNDK